MILHIAMLCPAEASAHILCHTPAGGIKLGATALVPEALRTRPVEAPPVGFDERGSCWSTGQLKPYVSHGVGAGRTGGGDAPIGPAAGRVGPNHCMPSLRLGEVGHEAALERARPLQRKGEQQWEACSHGGPTHAFTSHLQREGDQDLDHREVALQVAAERLFGAAAAEQLLI